MTELSEWVEQWDALTDELHGDAWSPRGAAYVSAMTNADDTMGHAASDEGYAKWCKIAVASFESIMAG